MLSLVRFSWADIFPDWGVIIAFLIQSVGRQGLLEILAIYCSEFPPFLKKKKSYFHNGLTCQNQQTMKYLPWQALGWQIYSTVSLYCVPVPRFLLFTESFYLPIQITSQTPAQYWFDYLVWFLCTLCAISQRSYASRYDISDRVIFICDLNWKSSMVIHLLCVYVYFKAYKSQILLTCHWLLVALSMWCRQEINIRFHCFIAFCCSALLSCIHASCLSILDRNGEVT